MGEARTAAEADPLPAGKIKLDPHQAPRWDWLNLPHLIDRVGIEPERPAIVFAGATRTYGELRERQRRVGNGLIGLGVEPMDRVAVLCTNCLEYMEIEIGIAAARAIMVPLNWRLNPQEVSFLMQRSEARTIFVEDRFVEMVAELRRAGQLPDLETLIVLGSGQGAEGLDYEDLCESSSAARPPREGRFGEPHEIIYTSGTTGDPKGAVWTNAMVCFNAIQHATDMHLTERNSHYTLVDQYYIGGRHAFVWGLLLQGGTSHVKPSGSFDGAAVARYWEQHGITHQNLSPTMLFDILAAPDLPERDLSRLEIVFCGGAPLPPSVLDRARELLPNTTVSTVFGMSEGGACMSFVPPRYAREKAGSVGRSVWHTQFRITGEQDRDLPANQVGELVARGATITPGYWDAPELTRESIVDGWLHTADLGYLDDDGFLFIVGRKKDMIISGGMNIYPAEIESVLLEHPAVADAAVIGVPHERWGETVCAVVQPVDEAEVAEAEIIAFCRERLASYKKPTVVHVVDEFPRTAIGKIKKFVLRERFGGAA